MHNILNNVNSSIKRLASYLLIFSFLFLLYTVLLKAYLTNDTTRVYIQFISNTNAIFQVFYDTPDLETQVDEEHSIKFESKGLGKVEDVTLDIPINNLTMIRLDVGDYEDNDINHSIRIKDIEIGGLLNKVKIDLNEMLNEMQFNHISEPYIEGDYLILDTVGADPYILLENISIGQVNIKILYTLSTLLSLITLFILYRFVHLYAIYNLMRNLYSDRALIFSLAKNDFKTKYAGSYFGVIWAFVQPITTILVFWFVFQIGFRAAPIKDVPFVLWLMAGLIPWFFFSDAWSSATNCFVEYSYLVRKVSFKISILPMIKVLSALLVHVIFIGFMIIIFSLCGIYPSIKIVQLLYFVFCELVLVVALSFITSSIVIFFKDLSQIISIVLQFGMWLTPIMWSMDMIPNRFEWIFKLNPMYYIVTGFRDTIISDIWFFLNIKQTFYFWITTGILFLIGAMVFRKLKPHFADIL